MTSLSLLSSELQNVRARAGIFFSPIVPFVCCKKNITYDLYNADYRSSNNFGTQSICRKSLRLKNESRQKYTTGQITNFMSVDAQVGRVHNLSLLKFQCPNRIIHMLSTIKYMANIHPCNVMFVFPVISYIKILNLGVVFVSISDHVFIFSEYPVASPSPTSC